MTISRNSPAPDETRERVFRFIVEYKKRHDGNSPSTKKIMEACGISSTSVVNYHIDRLIIAGRMTRGEGNCQLEIVGASWAFHEEFTEAVDKLR